MSKKVVKITEHQFKSLPEYINAHLVRKVRHLENSTDTSETWIEFWEENTGHEIPAKGITCPSCGETQTDILGGHVTDDATGEVFITPVCRGCNSKYKNSQAFTHHFHVKEAYLVRAPR